MSREAMKLALEALEILTDGYDGNEVGIEIDAMTALRQALEEEDVPCKTHPDAPHGFDRNMSHTLGRYVCECEYWEPSE